MVHFITRVKLFGLVLAQKSFSALYLSACCPLLGYKPLHHWSDRVDQICSVKDQL